MVSAAVVVSAALDVVSPAVVVVSAAEVVPAVVVVTSCVVVSPAEVVAGGSVVDSDSVVVCIGVVLLPCSFVVAPAVVVSDVAADSENVTKLDRYQGWDGCSDLQQNFLKLHLIKCPPLEAVRHNLPLFCSRLVDYAPNPGLDGYFKASDSAIA